MSKNKAREIEFDVKLRNHWCVPTWWAIAIGSIWLLTTAIYIAYGLRVMLAP